MLLDERVVIISGVGPGLGRSVALDCARHGAHVVLVARSEDRLGQVAKEVEAAGGRALVAAGDVTSPTDCDRVVTNTIDAFGGVDVLVNNAFQQPPFELLAQQSIDVVRESLEVNLFAALRLCQAVLPAMTERRQGSIVMVNSAILRHSRPAFGAYKMAKHALLGLARNLALEVGSYNVRVNSVAPGYIWGDAVQGFFEAAAADRGVSPQQVHDEVAATHALGFIPDADAIAEAVVFLASDMARAITGQCLDVNAGEYFD